MQNDTYFAISLGSDLQYDVDSAITEMIVISAGYNDNMPYDNEDIEWNPPFNATTYMAFGNYQDGYSIEPQYSDLKCDWVPTNTRDKLSLIVQRPRARPSMGSFTFPLDESFLIGVHYHTQYSDITSQYPINTQQLFMTIPSDGSVAFE
jgi:hypothetical protein